MRVKVIDPGRGPTTGKKYKGRKGTVLRTTPGGYVEVKLDSMQDAGIGLVAFRPDEVEDLPTKD